MIRAKESSLQSVLPWRDLYRQEMNCQITKDSIHFREGWTREYLLMDGPTTVGYGSVAVAGPWKQKPTIYEFHVAPPARGRTFALFEALLAASGAVAIETQSNDPMLTPMIHLYARDVASESILFHDRITTHHLPPEGAVFRPAAPEDAAQISDQNLDSDATWVLESGGKIAATGGILFHYNRPYGDIYMAVAQTLRQRGFGSYNRSGNETDLLRERQRSCRAVQSNECRLAKNASESRLRPLRTYSGRNHRGYTISERCTLAPHSGQTPETLPARL